MTVLTCYDASTPPAQPPPTDVVAFYIGGDTPHVWTPDELAAQTARYRLPIWARSDPSPALALGDARMLRAALVNVGCPVGSSFVLDLETAVTPEYVSSVAGLLKSLGYETLPYGSSSTLFSNPMCSGYFVAEPGATEIPANCVACQHTEDLPCPGGYFVDLSWILPTVPLWDTNPPAKEETVPDRIAIEGKTVAYVGANDHLIVATSTSGGWTGPGDVNVCDVTDVALKADPSGTYGVSSS